ncbi:hypothetical protein SFRURICE_013409, partial [Spodoptera frugiperda]
MPLYNVHPLFTIYVISPISDSTNCTYVDGVGLIAMKCVLEEYRNHRFTLRDVMARFWRIFLIWFLVYLAVAIPLWCTR